MPIYYFPDKARTIPFSLCQIKDKKRDVIYTIDSYDTIEDGGDWSSPDTNKYYQVEHPEFGEIRAEVLEPTMKMADTTISIDFSKTTKENFLLLLEHLDALLRYDFAPLDAGSVYYPSWVFYLDALKDQIGIEKCKEFGLTIRKDGAHNVVSVEFSPLVKFAVPKTDIRDFEKENGLPDYDRTGIDEAELVSRLSSMYDLHYNSEADYTLLTYGSHHSNIVFVPTIDFSKLCVEYVKTLGASEKEVLVRSALIQNGGYENFKEHTLNVLKLVDAEYFSSTNVVTIISMDVFKRAVGEAFASDR